MNIIIINDSFEHLTNKIANLICLDSNYKNNFILQINIKVCKFVLPPELIDLILKNNDNEKYIDNYTIISRLNKTLYINLRQSDIRHKYLNYRLFVKKNNREKECNYYIEYVTYAYKVDSYGRLYKMKRNMIINHRNPKNGPAQYTTWIKDVNYQEKYIFANKIHNPYGCALLHVNKNLNTTTKEYYMYDKQHRDGNKPAYIRLFYDQIDTLKYYNNGMLHRDDLGLKPCCISHTFNKDLIRSTTEKYYMINSFHKSCYKNHSFEYLCCNLRDFKLYYYDILVKCKTCSFINECTCFRLCQNKIEDLIKILSKHKCINNHGSNNIINRDIERTITKNKNKYIKLKCTYCEPYKIVYKKDKIITEEFIKTMKDGKFLYITKRYRGCTSCHKVDCDGPQKYNITTKNIPKDENTFKGNHTGDKHCTNCFPK